MTIEVIKEICDFLNISPPSLLTDNKKNDNEIFIPLIGEFNAGKTSLLNAILESCKLPVSNQPTTSTIFQVRFSSSTPSATIIKQNGEGIDISDMSSLSNDELYNDASMVFINDTSKLIPSNIVLVDSPGISSNFVEHTQAIADFIPYADALFVIVDVNTGTITQSLNNFLRLADVCKKPCYLIFTKTETMSYESVEQVKCKAISEDFYKQVISVDAYNEKIEEFFSLISYVLKDTDYILENSRNLKLESVKVLLINYLEEYLDIINSESVINPSIVESDLDLLNENIKSVFCEISKKVKEEERDIRTNFSEDISTKLDTIIQNKNIDYNLAARLAIEDAARFAFNDYKQKIETILNHTNATSILWDDSKEIRYIINEITKNGLSGFSSSEFTFDIDINSIGHEHDGAISKGVKLLVAAGVVAVAIYSGGSASGPVIKSLDTIANISDITCIQPNKNTAEQISKATIMTKGFVDIATNEYNSSEGDKKYGSLIRNNKGIVETIVGSITEKMSKPQKRKAILEYIESVLLPTFNKQLESIRKNSLANIEATMLKEANEIINNKKQMLVSIQQEWAEKKTNKSKAQNYLNQLNA